MTVLGWRWSWRGELPQQGREEMVLAGALGETHLSSWLSLEGLQKLPREGEKKIIKAETVPCVET